MRFERVSDLIDYAASRHAAPGRIFLESPSGRVYFSELPRRMRFLREGLATLGMRPDDFVLVHGSNGIELILLLLGISYADGRFAIIHPQASVNSLKDALEDSGARFVLTDQAELWKELGSDDLIIKDIHAFHDRWSQAGEDLAMLHEGPKEASLDELFVLSQEAVDDGSAVFFTSGTTGTRSKGVHVSHRNILFATTAIQKELQYRETDIIGLYIPLSFDVGLYQVFLSLVSGAALFVQGPRNLDLSLLKQLIANGVTVLPGVPFLFEILLKVLRRYPVSGGLRLRKLTNTGEALPPSVREELLMHMPNVELHLMYGLTECKRVSILSAHELQTRGESVGKPLPGTHVSLESIPGEPPEHGILIVTGPHVALGYLPADVGPFFRREGERFRSLRTGDVVSLDADGYIYFHYRKNLLIKHRGFRINPIEIESVLRSRFVDVQTCLVKHGQGDLILFVEDGADKKAIQAVLLEQVDGYKRPDRIVAIASFPQTSNGKLDRKRLSQWEIS